jgi:hypothetical protein
MAKPGKNRRIEDTRVFAPGPRRVIALGAALAALGLALLATGPSDAGTLILLFALISLLYGVHSFGRLGPEGEPSPEAAPAKPR